MKAKDKAKELFDKFYFEKDEDGYYSMNNYRAKQCALICIDEILKLPIENQSERNYLEEVKTEINKL